MEWQNLPNLVHGVCTYHRQWLHGDERGFRSRHHRIHSSGDYKNPPPLSEHEKLRQYMQNLVNGAPKFLAPPEYPIVGSAFVLKLLQMNCKVFIVACGCTHLHVLYQSVESDAQAELGKPKQYASYKLRHPSGKLWARGAAIIRVRGGGHAGEAFDYIGRHSTHEGAWVWRFDRDEPPTRATVDEYIKQSTRSRT